MPVFDFSGASASKAEAKCTYTTFHSQPYEAFTGAADHGA